MGMWVAIAIGLFALGSIMALKPSGIDMRLDALRMCARSLGLNPKLIACPDWIRGSDQSYGKGMIAQYAVLLEDDQGQSHDGLKLPHCRYQVLDGQWRVLQIPADNMDDSTGDSSLTLPSRPAVNQSLPATGLSPAAFYLDQHPVDLPSSIQPHIKALESKANCIIIYWHDIGYVRPASNPNYSKAGISDELQQLKQSMQQWAATIAGLSSSV